MNRLQNKQAVSAKISPWNRSPLPFAGAVGVLFTFLAAMGDWKVLNVAFGALPKAFSLGVVLCAVLCFCMKPDFERAKRAASFIPLFASLLMVYLVVTLAIWVWDLSQFNSMQRCFEKLGYQMVAIFYAVSMVYLFGRKAVDYFLKSMVLANSAIALIELAKHGIWSSIVSVYDGLISGGEAYGFMRSLELHDMTFMFGQLLLYYVFFAPADEDDDRKENRSNAFLCIFFVLLGYKRIIFPALAVGAFFVFFLKNEKKTRARLAVLGTLVVLLSYLYVYLIYSGRMVPFLVSRGIDLKGRETFWTLASAHYRFSPSWYGLGFEAVETLVKGWVDAGLLSKAFPLHNDFLKVFIELGFGGLAFWSGIQYLIYPQYWAKRHFPKCAALYFSILSYMSMTYLTDNTAFYFWSSIALRLLPMAYCYTVLDRETVPEWNPPKPGEVADSVRNYEAYTDSMERQ